MAAQARSTALLIRFFDPDQHARDARGRRLPDILGWSDSKLELCHDYIQMLFPLPEGSIFNSFAPVVTKEVRDTFLQRQDLRESQLHAFEKILNFYGLASTTKTIRDDEISSMVTIGKGPKWSTNSGNWVSRFNHNHLRITRVIRSLRVLGAEKQALAFFDCLAGLSEVRSHISPRSIMYWERAAKRPLHLPPDEDDDSSDGIAWLRDTSS